MREREALMKQRVPFALARPPARADDGEGEDGRGESTAQNSILQAGKHSSCMTTVLLEARTMMFRSCCLSWVCWYQSLVTSVSWVGIRVTWRGHEIITSEGRQEVKEKRDWPLGLCIGNNLTVRFSISWHIVILSARRYKLLHRPVFFGFTPVICVYFNYVLLI